MIPSPSGVVRSEVLDVELGLAEEDVGALLLEHDDRAQQHADRRRSTSRRSRPGSACPRRTTRNLRVAARSLRSSSGRSLSSQYLKISDRIEVWVSLRSRTLPSSSGPNEWTVARTCAPSLPDSDRNSTGWPAGSNVQPSDVDALDDLRVGRVARRGEPGQVALDVGDEDRHAGLRELAREQLEGLGLAGAGGAGDQPVAVEHRQGDLDARVVERARRRASRCR